MSGLRRIRAGLGGILLLIGIALAFSVAGRGAEVIPPAPRDHFNDYAGVIPSGVVRQLDAELTTFERESSNQIVVAVYPHMQSDSSISDYAVRIFQAWGIGGKKNNNGILLLVFSQDHTVWIQTGYGAEGPVPDALAKRIIENEITPSFRAGDFGAGLTSGVHALMAATRGEYRGTGQTVKEQGNHGKGGFSPILFVFVIILVTLILPRFRGPTIYNRRGYTTWINPGGGWGGGGSSGGGGGSFSGGGGSTGGGGAGGSW